jgi:DNA-binding transcriptional LysR family regulator
VNITLRQLRTFESVARHASISRAAAELHLTQPAVSMQVKQLEDQIGLPLIDQIGKRLCLTEAGTELCQHATRMTAQLVELNAAMDQFRGLERGVLRLAVVSTATYFLPKLIATFSARHPGVRISLQVVNRDAVLTAMADNQADLAITGQPPDHADIIARHFMDNPLVVIAAPGHRLAQGGPIPLQRLADEVLLLREPGSGTRAMIERHFTAHKIAYRPGCELSSNEALKQAVQAGLGIGIVPAQTLDMELETERLIVLPVLGFPIIRQWFILHRRDKRPSGASEAFTALLLAQHNGKTTAERRPSRAPDRSSREHHLTPRNNDALQDKQLEHASIS